MPDIDVTISVPHHYLHDGHSSTEARLCNTSLHALASAATPLSRIDRIDPRAIHLLLKSLATATRLQLRMKHDPFIAFVTDAPSQ